MTGMDPLFEIELDHPPKGSRESSRALYRQLKAAIVDGRLRPGAKLPPAREAKTFFGVSRNTATETYERLKGDGYVVARHGSGTYVADALPASPPRAPQRTNDPSDQRLNPFWLQPEVTGAINFWRDTSEHLPPTAANDEIDFRPAMVQSRLFPFHVFRRSIVKQLRQLEKRPASRKSPQGDQGNVYLRESIARHIAITRAVVCNPDDIVVTSGAQQAFYLLARILVKPNKTVVAMEDPGYPPMRVPFVAAGARVVPVEVDAEGLIIERLPPDAGVICVSPSHQFPLGVTMSRRRRNALVEFAWSRGAVIIEDDYDGEFRFDGAPLEALRSSEFADVVFYVGTFSKCMLPALRLGYVVAPDWAMSALITAKNSMDWQCSTLVQIGVSDFIAEGHLERHIRKMRQIYRKRRQVLLTGLKEHLSEWLEPQPSFYGMHVAALARTSLDLDRIADALVQNNVKMHTLSRYYLDRPTKAGLVFGYAVTDLTEIDRGLSLLRAALRS
jgi:GntR family transcriptional regulator / MocR family aminotransferase